MKKNAKKIITEEFLKLLNEKPISKISVVEIVERTGLNRNSFYYHFDDIYDVLNEKLTTDTTKLIKAFSTDTDWKRLYSIITGFASNYKHAVYHMYHSLSQPQLIKYLYTLIEKLITNYIDDRCKDLEINPIDREFVIDFFKNAIVGMTIEWINNGNEDDTEEFFYKLYKIFTVLIRQGLENHFGSLENHHL